MVDEMISAEMARSQANSVIASEVAKAVELAEREIDKAASEGKFSTTLNLGKFNFDMRKSLFDMLNSAGYKIEQSSDQRDFGYVNVSWKKR